MKKRLLQIVAIMVSCLPSVFYSAWGQANIIAAEYYIDNDPGFDKATQISLTPGTDISAQAFVANLSSVAVGVHQLHIRARDANGKWSLNSYRTFYKGSLNLGTTLPAEVNIVAAEYYIDTDPGFDNGTQISLTAGTNISAQAFVADLSSVADGVHQLHIRARDANGKWSLNSYRTFYKGSLTLGTTLPAEVNIVAAEYYIDTDPGFDHGTQISLTPGTDISAQAFVADLSSIGNGVHQLHIRGRDANGKWSLNSYRTFYKGSLTLGSTLPAAGNLIRLEYFFDSDPGFGLATKVSLPSNTVDSNFFFSANLPHLDAGAHILYVRAMDDWGITASYAFTAPGGVVPISLVSFYGQTVKNTSVLHWETTSEQNNAYFAVERSADGINFQNIGQVPGHGTTSSVNDYSFIDLSPLLNSINYYRLGQTDFDGHVTFTQVIALRFDQGPLTLQLYPNPTTGTLHLGIPTIQDKILIEVYDISGKLVISKQYGQPGTRVDLDVTGLAGGSYILKITQSNGQTIAMPFIRQ